MNDSVLPTLARVSVLLVFVVVVLGAFVRLSDAGLGCPDWPTCYGKATWPRSEHSIAAANEAFPERPVEFDKAWKEQVHRHLAAVLGLLVLIMALRRNWTPPLRRWLLLASAVAAAAGTLLYIIGYANLSAFASLPALAVPLALAFGIGFGRAPPSPWARFTAFLFALILFQAILGMWTVTWKLKPVVVMAHLLGGFSVLALLVWLALRSGRAPLSYPGAGWLRPWVWFGLAVLTMQIALGGWTSANYAALACPDFPTCQGQWWPSTDFREAFVLWRGIGVDYEGGLLDATARATIHLVHRIGAVITTVVLIVLAAALFRVKGMRGPALGLLALLGVQIALGIANVVAGLPLAVATAHNGVAALLVAQFMLILSRLSPLRS